MSAGLVAVALHVAWKGALLLLVTACVSWLLRRAAASVRHALWATAFGALLVLPVTEWAGPRWSVTLPAPLAEFGTPGTHEEAAAVPAHRPATAGPVEPGWASNLLMLWAVGAGGVLLVWLGSFAAARLLLRQASPVTRSRWLTIAEDARLQSGLRRPIRLLQSPSLDVPVAWGLHRPTVVLPLSADAWEPCRLRTVLLHEMAHLRRRDTHTQFVAQGAVALHWFNPLAWLAYRRFLVEREHACDDAVLGKGLRATTYATHLVEIARDARRRRLALAGFAAGARTSALEGRVLAILDPERQRSAGTRRSVASVVGVSAALLLPVAAFRPAAPPVCAAPPVVVGCAPADTDESASTTTTSTSTTSNGRESARGTASSGSAHDVAGADNHATPSPSADAEGSNGDADAVPAMPSAGAAPAEPPASPAPPTPPAPPAPPSRPLAGRAVVTPSAVPVTVDPDVHERFWLEVDRARVRATHLSHPRALLTPSPDAIREKLSPDARAVVLRIERGAAARLTAQALALEAVRDADEALRDAARTSARALQIRSRSSASTAVM